jgi:hypothetical protein
MRHHLLPPVPKPHLQQKGGWVGAKKPVTENQSL